MIVVTPIAFSYMREQYSIVPLLGYNTMSTTYPIPPPPGKII